MKLKLKWYGEKEAKNFVKNIMRGHTFAIAKKQNAIQKKHTHVESTSICTTLQGVIFENCLKSNNCSTETVHFLPKFEKSKCVR